VLREYLIRIAAVDFLTFGCGSWDHDFMAHSGPPGPQWHGSIPRLFHYRIDRLQLHVAANHGLLWTQESALG